MDITLQLLLEEYIIYRAPGRRHPDNYSLMLDQRKEVWKLKSDKNEHYVS